MQVVDSTRERDEPMSLEVGVGDIIGNPLAQALDKAVRSRSVGDQVELELQGGEYKRDLVFTVPLDHQEVQRLQGRYSSQGGLQVDKIVELANGNLAKVLKLTEEEVVLDANNMLAGTQRFIDIEVLRIDRTPA